MRKNRSERKPQRREAAVKREAAWRELSPKAQLIALDNRLGKGLGAKKQRARLKTA